MKLNVSLFKHISTTKYLWLFSELGSTEGTVRGCMSLPKDTKSGECRERNGKDVCFCTMDKCNSAELNKPGILMFFTIILILLSHA